MAENKDQISSQAVCLRCGKLVSSQDSFCVSCGSDLKAPAVPGQSGVLREGDFADLMAAGRQADAVPASYINPYEGAYPGIQPYAMPVYNTRRTEELAVISLVCAVGSFVVLPLFPAIAAVILGSIARKHIRNDPAGLEGDGLAIAGIAIGLVNIIVVVIVAVLVVIAAISEATLLFV